MGTETGSWYLLAYDIADPRRLQRVHRCLSRTGIRVQRSVFFVFAAPARLAALLDEVEGLMHKREDDLRAYPITQPGELWFQGRQVLSGPLLRPGEAPAASHPESHSPGVLRRLFERLRVSDGGR
ncbi:MAG: CRISPR-associated endonuclease Cas2 [Gammaproteobacteria bacterium]